MSSGPAILVATYPPAERGRALGAQAMLTYVGLTLGPTIGGYLTSLGGWRGVFWAAATVALALAAAAPFVLPASAPRRDVSVEAGVALAIGVVSSTLVFGLHRAATRGGVDLVGGAALGTGVAFAVLVVLREARADVPFIPRSLAASFEMRRGVAAAIAQYASTFSLGFATPFLLQQSQGLSPHEAGLWMTVQPAAMVLSSPIAGVLSDRMSPRPIALAGLTLIAGGGALLAFSSSTMGLVVAGLCLVGLGSGFFTTPNTALALGAAEPSSRTTASAILAWARNVGMAVGVATAALVFAITGGVEAAFAGCAAACAVFALLGAGLYAVSR
jgi:MFS family permease